MQTTWQSAATLATLSSAAVIEWLTSLSEGGRRPHCKLVTRETKKRTRIIQEKGKGDETMLVLSTSDCALICYKFRTVKNRFTVVETGGFYCERSDPLPIMQYTRLWRHVLRQTSLCVTATYKRPMPARSTLIATATRQLCGSFAFALWRGKACSWLNRTPFTPPSLPPSLPQWLCLTLVFFFFFSFIPRRLGRPSACKTRKLQRLVNPNITCRQNALL